MTVDDLPPLPAHTMDMHLVAIPMRLRDDAKRHAERYAIAYARAAIAQAVEKEREACAKVCEIMADDLDMWRPLDGSRGHALRNAAKRIRSASKENGNG